MIVKLSEIINIPVKYNCTCVAEGRKSGDKICRGCSKNRAIKKVGELPIEIDIDVVRKISQETIDFTEKIQDKCGKNTATDIALNIIESIKDVIKIVNVYY